MNKILERLGRFTEHLKLYIPNKNERGNIVTTVLEPNFDKIDEAIKLIDTKFQVTTTEEIKALINENKEVLK